jgi:hypothetical protein
LEQATDAADSGYDIITMPAAIIYISVTTSSADSQSGVVCWRLLRPSMSLQQMHSLVRVLLRDATTAHQK